MTHARRIAFATIVLMSSFVAPAFANTLEEAAAALARGDYATGLRLLRPFAEQGDARAQYNMGVSYEQGWGVPQNNAEAMKWYRLAADQG